MEQNSIESLKNEMEKIKEEIISLSLSSTHTADLLTKYDTLINVVKSISINKLLRPVITKTELEDYDPEIRRAVEEYAKALNDGRIK